MPSEMVTTAGASAPSATQPATAKLNGRLACQSCPITDGCLDYALASSQQFGVWGGLTAVERGELIVAEERHQIARPGRRAS